MKVEIVLDNFDRELLPFGKKAGDNKFNAIQCPTCTMAPTHVDTSPHDGDIHGEFYLFRNELSAKEYYISGMCQHCQDSVFGAD